MKYIYSIFLLGFTSVLLAQNTFKIDDSIVFKQQELITHTTLMKNNNSINQNYFAMKNGAKTELITAFSNGYALARKSSGTIGVINRYYEWVIKPKYVKVEIIGNREARVKTLNGVTKTIYF